MSLYKVLKDFPSRNGAKLYKAGSDIQLNENARTKALVEMGFIIEKEVKSDLIVGICHAICELKEIRRCRAIPYTSYGSISLHHDGHKYFLIDVEVQ